ncbi:MAG: hypothetical protein GF346_10150, partial [Candidatus Eisenbacteria bacterium]|nr:hypothetical protein [Candidatus Latescibacterota bacterium]MBD3302796.1 hypothetical protein [Candidatus Eisenbacteria bacterium]
CNDNGIPDECEEDPCAVEEYALDHGSDPESADRSLSGDPTSGFEIFQPFDLDEETTLRRIDLDGWTVNHHPQGFRATLFADDGTGDFPDEAFPIESADYRWRFSGASVVWVGRPFRATLPPGRYWLRLTALDPTYDAAAHVGITGLPSLSRRNGDGQIYHASRSIAMRIVAGSPASVSDPAPAGPVFDLRVEPNPTAGPIRAAYRLPVRTQHVASIHDVAGRRIRTLFDGTLPAGRHALTWDGRDDGGRRVENGVYYLRIASGVGRIARPIGLVR